MSNHLSPQDREPSAPPTVEKPKVESLGSLLLEQDKSQKQFNTVLTSHTPHL
jgi:hypothetical protein